MKVIRGKKALVTGAASGIGHGRFRLRRSRGLVVITPLARAWWWVARLFPDIADWIAREGWRSKGRLTITQR